MTSAMVDGLIAKGAYPPAKMICMGGSGTSAPALSKRTGIRLAGSLEELLAGAGTLVVAFKPQHLASADPRLAALTEGRLVISVLAGKKIEALARAFPEARNIVRSMPNTPSQIGAGITGWCSRAPLGAADRAVSSSGLRLARGLEIEIPEAKMDALHRDQRLRAGLRFRIRRCPARRRARPRLRLGDVEAPRGRDPAWRGPPPRPSRRRP